jgi:hypothetical protein
MTIHTTDISTKNHLPDQISNFLSETTIADHREIPRSLANMGDFLGLEADECRFLFQFPAILIGEQSEGAAAILCRDKNGMRLVFLVLSHDGTQINTFEEDDVSEHLANFTWSFANILSVLPSCESLPSQ